MLPPRDDVGRRNGVDRLAAWILGGATFLTLLTFLVPGIDVSICRHFPDDALFYNLIARNLLAGHGSTCDGLSQSNGYHPLWLLIHMGIEWLPRDWAMAAQLGLMFMMNAAAAWLLYTGIVALRRPGAALPIALLATFEQSLFQVTWSGMETTLAWLILLAMLQALRAGPLESATPGRLWWTRLGLLALMLARLDGALFWIAVAIASIARAPLRPSSPAARVGFLVRLFLPPTVVVGAYLAFNQWWFHTAMPISGRIKSIAPLRVFSGGFDWGAAWIRFQRLLIPDPVDRLQSSMQSLFPGADIAVVLLFLVLLSGALLWVLNTRGDDFSLRCLTLYVGLHVAYYSLLQSDPYSIHWAKGPELLLTLIVAACVLERVLGTGQPGRRLATSTCLILVIAFGVYSHSRRLVTANRIYDFSVARTDFFAAADFIDRTIPPDERIITWNIGFLGYYTKRPVVSHDGLLNSREYYEDYLSKGRVADYMRAHRIRYIANRVPRAGDPALLLAGQFSGLRSEDFDILAIFDGGLTQEAVQNRYVVARCRW